MNCEHRIKLDWKRSPFYISIGLCKLQKCEPVYCPKFKQECPVYIKEYNLDTSAQHPTKDDDIVRSVDINETTESKDKEL